jgi:NADP-dependent 3-hydroxy acid dehydrogenase YdfG
MADKWKRVAIVTGATSGIGEATALKFASEGFGVVGNGRNAGKLKTLEKELGPAFCGVPGDASDEDVLEQLFVSAVERFGREADIVVVNAGRGLGGSVKDADLSQLESVLKINVRGACALMQKAARRMTFAGSRPPGAPADIVVIGSVVGRHISPFSAVYGSTKFAVKALAEGLRRELAPKAVRVTLVEPGIVLSGFQDAAGYSDQLVQSFTERFGPLLTGQDIAGAVLCVVTQPPHVHISNITVRPTGQDYP